MKNPRIFPTLLESSGSIGSRPVIEILEQRIAPAAIDGNLVTAVNETPIHVGEGQLLTTSGSGGGGAYLLYVEKGEAVVFTTDLNHDGDVDFNEITGIAAGNGLRLISFVDIHGDIVTNLLPSGELTDSDNNLANGRDGKVVLNSLIEKIELRSITAAEISDQNFNGTVDDTDVSLRLAQSSYSIFGNIYAGAGFGAEDGGLIIDTTGKDFQAAKFTTTGTVRYVETVPEIGSIKVGTAVSGQVFSFGYASEASGAYSYTSPRGLLATFIAPPNVHGADIIGVRAASPDMLFNLGTLQAGDGGFGGRGGNVENIQISGDHAGGYSLIAGDGGAGENGKKGGSIINFSDFGSITGQVLLQSGNGGEGLLGSGGNGGSIAFSEVDPVNIAGRIVINLGHGGDGFINGGAGGSLKNGTMTTPGDTEVPEAKLFVSTTRDIGDIGNSDPIDFDGDGFSDAVYTTVKPDQLVVLFGNGSGFDETRTLFLNSPANPQALVVADFDGDGDSDIAVASGNASFAGVSVFLNIGNSGVFTDAIYSPLYYGFGYQDKAVPILNLTAGDYDGDGVMDLALTTIQTTLGTSPKDKDVVFVMRGLADDANPDGSGFFFSDTTFGTIAPILDLGDHADRVILKSTALTAGNTIDVFLGGQTEKKSISTFDYSSGILLFGPSIGLGKVDTNRDISDPGKKNEISLEDATLLDFAILDMDGDNIADIAVLASSPEGFLVTFKGDGTTFAVASNERANSENSGIEVNGSDSNKNFVGILAVNADGDVTGAVNDIAIVDYRSNNTSPQFIELKISDDTALPDSATTDLHKATTIGTHFFLKNTTGFDEDVRAFDVYIPQPTVFSGSVGYGVALPNTGNRAADFLQTTGDAPLPLPFDPGAFYSLARNGLFLTAGNGGDGETGAGGNGGVIGNKLLSDPDDPTSVHGTFSYEMPTAESYEAVVRLVGGDGGNGYTAGGNGGKIVGTTVTYVEGTPILRGTVLLLAGNGGNSVAGQGGKGGGLDQLFIQTGDLFVAGDGGDGYIGGKGGSVFGNRIEGLPDTQTNSDTNSLAVIAGDGGDGIARGGKGGSIKFFVPNALPVISAVDGLLHYEAGDGGTAVAGRGGNGGSILSSSLFANNHLAGDIFLKAGAGGDGLSGGNGGRIDDFINQPDTGIKPTSFTALAGNGGIGFSGNGGAGGDITNIAVDSTGTGTQHTYDTTNRSVIESLDEAETSEVFVANNRVIAGAGGASLSEEGGKGGSVLDITSSAESVAYVVAAGEGGDGITLGGKGGSVKNASINSAGGAAKVLIIAGDGGDATGSKDGFGGVNGKAGNGGSIVNFTQPDTSGTKVDLIAGNGGSTPNHGTTGAATTKVGKGGSIKHATITGDIGNVDATVAIRSYNDYASGQTMAEFIAASLIADPSIAITDEIGNVGLVAGVMGRVENGSHPSAGQNGSVIDVHARNIMSMVAGSVDEIASIELLEDVGVTIGGGVFGADKSVDSDFGPASLQSDDGVFYTVGGGVSSLDYLDENGDHLTQPVLGGKLVDGAIIAKNVRTLQSIRDFVR